LVFGWSWIAELGANLATCPQPKNQASEDGVKELANLGVAECRACRVSIPCIPKYAETVVEDAEACVWHWEHIRKCNSACVWHWENHVDTVVKDVLWNDVQDKKEREGSPKTNRVDG